MLVLTRKPRESVIVGNSIRITVIELSHGAVRLGFEAPPEVSIYREEIYREIAKANRSAFEEPREDGGVKGRSGTSRRRRP